MEDVLFEIKDLSCSYTLRKDQKALYINNLQIPGNRLVFLLGASGCGKSTLLETLGLMNNTIAGGEIILNAGNDKQIALHNLWSPGNYANLTHVRRQYYSFIFQNTNLMENFTAYENICLSGMIKQDVVQDEVLEQARKLMARVKLPEAEVDLNTLSVNLSGGQRQRVSFVRALNNKASILFGDEPTGNLDEANAHELFEIVKAELSNGLSAIIVSHDIDLAVKYADQIIVITKDDDKSYGEVHPENIFGREYWASLPAEDKDSFKDKLRDFYKAGNEKTIPNAGKDQPITAADTSLNYNRLFFKKEGKVLFGKNWGNFLILSAILFFTFLAIGFANGSLTYLKEKMSSAFVNWITVSVPFGRGFEKADMESALKELNAADNKKKYSYDQVTPYVEYPVYVWNNKQKSFTGAESRSVNVEEDAKLINDFVLNRENLIIGKKNGFNGPFDLGLIVTREFLKEMGYPENATTIYCEKYLKDTINKTESYNKVPIPIRSIVKELPSKCKIIYTDFFYNSFLRFGDNSKAFDISKNNNLVELFYQEANLESANKLKELIKNYFSSNEAFNKVYFPIVSQSMDTLGYVGGYKFRISFDAALQNSASADSLITNLKKHLAGSADTASLQRMYSYNPYPINENPTYTQISVYFKTLNYVRDFSKYLKANYNKKDEPEKIEVDITKVKEKENFNFLSSVTRTISLLLVTFSALSVCLFIFNLLRNHLLKVKMNIGTLKAIGLKDNDARNIYYKIILLFIALSCLAGLLLAWLAGYAGNRYLVENMAVEQDVSYFSLFHRNTLAALLIILISAFIISKITIARILNKTPGNLIYNR